MKYGESLIHLLCEYFNESRNRKQAANHTNGSLEKNRRAAILESILASIWPKEIKERFGYRKSLVYGIAKTLNLDRERTANFVEKLRKEIEKDPGRIMSRLSSDMGIVQSNIRSEVHGNLCYRYFLSRNRQSLTKISKLAETQM